MPLAFQARCWEQGKKLFISGEETIFSGKQGEGSQFGKTSSEYGLVMENVSPFHLDTSI